MNYDSIASPEIIAKTMASAQSRGMQTHHVANRAEALDVLKSLVPSGAEVMSASSKTLEAIGFADLLKSGQHPWKNLRAAIVHEKDPATQALLRKQSTLADYFVGSVHALTEAGQTITASASGSQIPSYAFSSKHVIWVVGAQKIVPTLEDGIKRIREYVFPLEDQRMKSLGAPGSAMGMIFIFEKVTMGRIVHLIVVDETLGF